MAEVSQQASHSHRSLERYDAISDCAQAVGPTFVHHVGQPINQDTKTGFNRRRKIRSVGDNSRPSWIDWTRCENRPRSVCSASDVPPLRFGRSMPLWSRVVGVAQVIA